MTPSRLSAVAFVFVCTAVAWLVLGGSVVERTGETDQRLAKEVAALWGGRHSQAAPTAWYTQWRDVKEDVEEKDASGRSVTRTVTRKVEERVGVPLTSSRVAVGFDLDQRRKGLLWYDTYGVTFSGRYRFQAPEGIRDAVQVQLAFPSTEAIYDGFSFRVNGHEAQRVSDLSKGIVIPVAVAPGGEVLAEVSYRSRGLGEWTYAFAGEGIAQVRDFRLEMTTDFDRIDFPAGTLSPTTLVPEGEGRRLVWSFESLVTGQRIGMDPPDRLNPGPLAARITFFAPVGLLFFVTVTVILGLIRGRSLHPMHYFFISAAFFAFHLLLAYLVDHLDIHAAFAIAAAVSVFLVTSYLRLVVGLRAALLEAGLAQVVFLVLFSYAFFFEGYTGLTVTVGAVLTLFVLMQITGRVEWERVFRSASTSGAQ